MQSFAHVIFWILKFKSNLLELFKFHNFETMKMQILTLFNLNRTFSFHIWMVFLFIVLRNFRILVYIHMLYHKNHELVVTRSLCSRLWGQRPTECDISCPADLCLSPLLRPSLSTQASHSGACSHTHSGHMGDPCLKL